MPLDLFDELVEIAVAVGSAGVDCQLAGALALAEAWRDRMMMETDCSGLWVVSPSSLIQIEVRAGRDQDLSLTCGGSKRRIAR